MTYHTLDEWSGFRLREMRDQGVVIERWLEEFKGTNSMQDEDWYEVEDMNEAYYALRDRLAEVITK